MLPHYSPLKVAETFSILAALLPRPDRPRHRPRGRHRPADHASRCSATAARRLPDDFPQQLAELLAYLEDQLPGRPPVRPARRALPGRPERPEPWLLGSSPQSALWAAELGLPYAFADFINPGRRRDRGRLPRALRRRRRRAGARSRRSRVGHLRRHRRGGPAARREQPDGVHAAAPRRADPGAAGGEGPARSSRRATAPGGRPPRRRRAVVGSPATVRAGLEAVADEYGADELIVVTITHDHGARRRSYELLAEAFGLSPRA